MFRAVVLDFDWTFNTSMEYYDCFDEVFLRVIAERLGFSIAEAEKKVEEAKKKTLSLTCAMQTLNLDSDELYTEIARKMNIAGLLTNDKRLRDVVKNLRRMDLKVAMLTNSGRYLLSRALDALGCPAAYFDIVLTSSEVEPKPSLKPFIYVTHLLNCKPEEVLYVGDRILSELKPAKMVGMKTVLVGRQSGTGENQWVNWTIMDIFQLPQLVHSLKSNFVT